MQNSMNWPRDWRNKPSDHFRQTRKENDTMKHMTATNRRRFLSTWVSLATMVGLCAHAQVALGPLLEISQPNPLVGCDDGFRLPGTMTINDSAEPFVAVNPVNANNLVAAWIGGIAQANVAASSFDGGQTWQQVPLPLTSCAGGTYTFCADPWLAFAPNGDLYVISLGAFSFSSVYTAVMKSRDGGLHWSAPVIIDTAASSPDKTTITADPSDSRYVYAAWVRQPVKNRTTVAFSRTTDGGLTWEPARAILTTSPGQQAFNPQVVVLPDGTLVEIFYSQFAKPNQAVTQIGLELMRSSDHGLTWSAPLPGPAMQTILRTDGSGYTVTVDPDTGQLVLDTTDPSFAVDNSSGNLYAVWEDGRFSNFQYNDIAFSMSSDGGFTWSSPIRINQTPLNIPPLDRQAFMPVIAVAANGTIGVTYYDFRFNTPDPGLPTDYWMVRCHPSPGTSPADPSNWGNEVRLTDNSFNLENGFLLNGGLWLGDYFGLAPVGHGGFMSVFGAVDQNNHTSMFARAVGK
jgi:hypothetical protein